MFSACKVTNLSNSSKGICRKNAGGLHTAHMMSAKSTRGLCKIHVSRLCFPHVDYSISSCGFFVCIGLPLQNRYGAAVSPTDDVNAPSLHSNRLKCKEVDNKELTKSLQTYSSVRRRSGEKTLWAVESKSSGVMASRRSKSCSRESVVP